MKTIIRYSIILLLFSHLTSCIHDNNSSNLTIHLEDEIIKIYLDKLEGTTNLNLYPDTAYKINIGDDILYYFKTGRGSDLNGLFFLGWNNNEYKIIECYIDTLSIYSIDFFLSDIDHTYPPEIISIWNHEGDEYYFRISKIESSLKINEVFKSQDLGVPWIGEGNMLSIMNDTLFFLHMKNDGSGHQRSYLNIDEEGNLSPKFYEEIQ